SGRVADEDDARGAWSLGPAVVPRIERDGARGRGRGDLIAEREALHPERVEELPFTVGAAEPAFLVEGAHLIEPGNPTGPGEHEIVQIILGAHRASVRWPGVEPVHEHAATEAAGLGLLQAVAQPTSHRRRPAVGTDDQPAMHLVVDVVE